MNLLNATVSAPQVAAVLGLIIPFLVALATKVTANRWTKTAVAAVLAGASAVVASLNGVTGDITWTKIVTCFIVAVAVAGGARKSLLEDAVNWVANVTKVFGIGKKYPAVDTVIGDVQGALDPTNVAVIGAPIVAPAGTQTMEEVDPSTIPGYETFQTAPIVAADNPPQE